MASTINTKLEEVADKLGHEFENPKLLLEALILMLAGCQTNQQLQQAANMRCLVRNFDLYGLAAYTMNNPSQQGQIPPKTKATTVEAIIGAICKDGGVKPAKAAMTLFGLLLPVIR